MNEATSSVEPEVKTRFDILFVKILKLYSFFLNQFYCFETLEMSSFNNVFVGLKQLHIKKNKWKCVRNSHNFHPKITLRICHLIKQLMTFHFGGH